MHVPEGWTEGKVSDLVKSLDAGVSVNSENKRPECGQFSVLKTSCVSYGSFNRNERKVVLDVNEIGRLKEPVKGNTIIISRMNTPALVGANAYVSESLENTYLPDRLWQVKPRKNSVNMLWLGLWFNSKHTRYLLSNFATGTSGSMKNITKSDVLSIRINIPPLPEQQKIAQILSTWDKAIGKLEALIAAKKKRKKALMQQLLTGSIRFSGFAGEWIIKRLDTVVKNFIVPMRDKPEMLNGPIPWCRIEDFNGTYLSASKSKQGVTEKTIEEMNLKVYPVGTLLVSCSADLGRCAIVVNPLVTNQTFIGLVPDSNKINVLFLYYLISNFAHRLNTLSSGTTISYLSRKEFEKFSIKLPEIIEQQKIAAVLSSADKEIAVHQNQLAALKQQKKGLMQHLLTGKKRVNVNQAAA
jgi:type I restriction enzyme S subunit